jgi:L-2-hydroxyglutarate oxidase LhgO
LHYEEIQVAELNRYGFNSATVSNLWRCNEGVVDNGVLRDLIHQKLIKSGVQILLGNEILEISKNLDSWIVNSKEHSSLFDVVILATYYSIT